MKNSETFERYEIEYQNADYYGEYKYADLLSISLYMTSLV